MDILNQYKLSVIIPCFNEEKTIQEVVKRINYLGINNLTVVPESICKMIPQLTTLNISQNSICPPYPNCIETFLLIK